MGLGDRLAITDYGVLAIIGFLGVIASWKALQHDELSSDAYRLVLGIFMASLWTTAHQAYWFARWWLKAAEDPLTEWFLEHSWALVPVYWVKFIGALMIAHALFRSNCFTQEYVKGRIPWAHGFGVWLAMVAVLYVVVFLSIP